MNEHLRRAFALVAAVAATSAALLIGGGDTRAPERRDDDATTLLAAAAPEGFARAAAPRALRFPRDHAAHPDYRTEWWYFTGHLSDDGGRLFGFQLTLFRFELDRRAPGDDGASAWRTPRVMMGHFALSDVAAQEFHAFERLARALPGIAGVDDTPLAVWIDDWRIERDAADGRWRLHAAQQGVRLELELAPASAIVAHGDAGLSQKSSAPGNASYYYSIPRLRAEGHVDVGGRTRAVRGTAWLDREWSTSALARDQQGWDWFALHLDDGASLMYYRLRRADGGTDRHSAGTFVAADGASVALDAADVELEVLSTWTSAATGITWPQRWRLAVPRLDLTVELEPRFAAQEWRGRFRYWEGAVAVAGGGSGYVEMTGYTPGKQD